MIALTVDVAACASVGHSWQDEFTARLEGASGSIEEAREVVRTETSEAGYPETFLPLSRTLFFKAELIANLNPPDGCEAVQEQGLEWIGSFASESTVIPRSMTPELEKDLPRLLEGEIEALEALEAKAETCASG